MVEKILAGVGLAVCVVLLLAMGLGERRRQQLRAAAVQWLRWPQSRARARREATEAIQRAHARSRHAVEREGNVYRPRSFDPRGRAGDGGSDDRTLH